MSHAELSSSPRSAIPYVFCVDAGVVADWCVEVLGFVERQRWHDDAGVVRNVELVVGVSEVWLDGPVPDWRDKSGGLPSWVGVLVDDVEAVHDRLTAAGVVLDPPRTRDHGVREIAVTDPEGHVWGFVQRLDRTPRPPLHSDGAHRCTDNHRGTGATGRSAAPVSLLVG